MKHETNKYNSVVCRRNILSLSRFRNLCKTNEKVVSVCSDDEEGGGRKSKMGVVYWRATSVAAHAPAFGCVDDETKEQKPTMLYYTLK